MPYCEWADFVPDLMSMQEAVDWVIDETTEAAHDITNAAVVTAAQDKVAKIIAIMVDPEISANVNNKYKPVPMAPVPTYLKTLAIRLTIFHLHLRRNRQGMSEEMRAEEKGLQTRLDALRKGEASLYDLDTDAAQEATDEHAVTTVATSLLFDADELASFRRSAGG